MSITFNHSSLEALPNLPWNPVEQRSDRKQHPCQAKEKQVGLSGKSWKERSHETRKKICIKISFKLLADLLSCFYIRYDSESRRQKLEGSILSATQFQGHIVWFLSLIKLEEFGKDLRLSTETPEGPHCTLELRTKPKEVTLTHPKTSHPHVKMISQKLNCPAE